MSRRDGAARGSRVKLVATVDGEELRVRAKRNLPVLLFLIVFGVIWAIPLVLALAGLVEQVRPSSLLLVAFFLALWLSIVAMIGWYSGGATVLRVKRGDLEIGFRLLGMTWARRYQGSRVRDLCVSESPPYYAGRQSPLLPGEGHCIRFSHDGRTVHAATGLEEADAQTILSHLRKRGVASGLRV